MAKAFAIEFAPDDLEYLKTNGYLLCVASAADSGKTLVVWRCFSDYLEHNPFSLIDQYEVFGTSSFKIGEVVTIDTETMAIAPGQQTVLTADAKFLTPTDGTPGNIIINSGYPDPIHIGFSNTLTGPDNVQQTTPLFVSDAVTNFSTYVYLPLDKLQVWLQQNAVTGVIINADVVNAAMIDLTKKDFVKLTYQNGEWSEQSAARPGVA
ncbi:MAG: hypothetical protein V7632_2844 [Bradyrhizobium sp.]|jgi:hypothetical protein